MELCLRSCANPPAVARQITWYMTAHPEAHQRAYQSKNGVGMVCMVSVKKHSDERLISMTCLVNNDITFSSAFALSSELNK